MNCSKNMTWEFIFHLFWFPKSELVEHCAIYGISPGWLASIAEGDSIINAALLYYGSQQSNY